MHFSLRSRHLRPSLLASSLLLAVSAQGQEKLDVDLPAAPLGQAINSSRNNPRYRSSSPAISAPAARRPR